MATHTLKTVQFSEDDLRIIRTRVVPLLELEPGRGDGFTDEDDEALWTFIDKLKGASDE